MNYIRRWDGCSLWIMCVSCKVLDRHWLGRGPELNVVAADVLIYDFTAADGRISNFSEREFRYHCGFHDQIYPNH